MEMRRLLRDFFYNSFVDGELNIKELKLEVVLVEMYVGGEFYSMFNGRLGLVGNFRWEWLKGFYNKFLWNVLYVLEDGEIILKDIGFYNVNFKNEFMDSGFDYFCMVLLNMSFDEIFLVDESIVKGYYNKIFKNNFMEDDGVDDVFVKKSEELMVVDKLKSGKVMGFYNKIFYFEFMDFIDNVSDGVCVLVLSGFVVGEVGDKIV